MITKHRYDVHRATASSGATPGSPTGLLACHSKRQGEAELVILTVSGGPVTPGQSGWSAIHTSVSQLQVAGGWPSSGQVGDRSAVYGGFIDIILMLGNHTGGPRAV